MKTRPFFFLTYFLALQVVRGQNTETKQQESIRSNISKIEQAAQKVYDESILRDAELSGKILTSVNRLQELTAKAGDSKKPIAELLSRSELDEFNLAKNKIQYLSNCAQAEVLKRRALKEVMSILEINRITNETHQDLIDSDKWGSASEINAAVTKRRNAQIGLNEIVWNDTLDRLAGAQQARIALTMPFGGLVDKLRNASFPSPDSDDLGLFFHDAYPNNFAAKILFKRLQDAAANGDSDAKDVLRYLSTEWRTRGK